MMAVGILLGDVLPTDSDWTLSTNREIVAFLQLHLVDHDQGLSLLLNRLHQLMSNDFSPLHLH
jgi:hypothetical protein